MDQFDFWPDSKGKRTPETYLSKALVEETYAIIRNNHVSEVAKSDPLIIMLGNNWMPRNAGNLIIRKYYTSSIMRLSAKFKMALLEYVGNTKEDLNGLLQPANYELIAKAALRCCNAEEDDDLMSPSNAIKLGYDVRKIRRSYQKWCER